MVNAKILVIGESCLDKFTYCNVERLAPDLPIPVLEQVSSTENPGMAHNVVRNIAQLGHNAELLTNENWETHIKERFVDVKTNHTFVRVDQRRPVGAISNNPVFEEFEMIIISDYDKGFLSREKIKEICSRNTRVIIDTKKPISEFAVNAMLIKINENEMRSSTELSDLLREKTIVTLGPRGASFRGVDYPVEDPTEIYDTSGAGDAFLASLSISILEGASVVEAIRQANLDAGSVVGRKGVSTIER